MQQIRILEYDMCDSERKELYDGQIKQHGRITNMKKTLLNSPLAFKVLMEWYPLRDEVNKFVDNLGVNTFCYGISAENDCIICSTFFRRLLIDTGYNPDKLELTGINKLLWDYGRALVSKPRDIPQDLFNELKKHYDEEQIVLLTAFGGMMIATNLINNALDVPLDSYLTNYAKNN
ncbi:MAG: hypothetical protein LBE09_00225 [Christensenellaceae bacterium]|nr:hypothetical protein [Christensenellaceae bacterium]